jgi:hypothetical protein
MKWMRPGSPPDHSVAVALAKQVVPVLDGRSGNELARLTDFTNPDAIVFEKIGAPAAR